PSTGLADKGRVQAWSHSRCSRSRPLTPPGGPRGQGALAEQGLLAPGPRPGAGHAFLSKRGQPPLSPLRSVKQVRGRAKFIAGLDGKPGIRGRLGSDAVGARQPPQQLLPDAAGRGAVARSAQAQAQAVHLVLAPPLLGPGGGESKARVRSPALGVVEEGEELASEAGQLRPPPWEGGTGAGRVRRGARRHGRNPEARRRPLRVRRAGRDPGGGQGGPPALAGVPRPQPAVARHLAGRGPGRGAELQQLGDEGLAALGQLEPVGVQHAALLAPGQAGDVRVVEGHAARDHDVEHHAQAPHVVLLGVVGDAQQHLGGRVGGRAAVGGAEVRVAVRLAAEAEVRELDPALVRAQQHVLALEVAVHQVVVVQVAHGARDLREEVARLRAGDAPVALHGLQQVGGGRLHHDVQLPVAHLDELEDVHDVRVPHAPQDGQLARQELVDEVRRRSPAVHHLDGHRALVLLGRGHLHLGVAALSYGAAQLIAEFAQEFVARHGGARGARGAAGGGRTPISGLTHGAWHPHPRTPMCPLPRPRRRGGLTSPR
uniref:Uncharacterized protein n=1 Tax=Oryctolagus cuniculus TaxID=9986 RepID=A0A5F9DDB3_RABIT